MRLTCFVEYVESYRHPTLCRSQLWPYSVGTYISPASLKDPNITAAFPIHQHANNDPRIYLCRLVPVFWQRGPLPSLA